MKIVILHGSPKGEKSVTMQYVKFIQKKNPHHEYILHNVSKRIKQLEKNEDLFNGIIEDINSSDGIIWSFPVYTCFVPAQYLRFIELIGEKKSAKAFKNKYTVAISTSIHFYDYTAHRYINAVCDDLDMNYAGFYSAEMDDLLNAKERKNLLKFAGHFFNSIKNKIHCLKKNQPLEQNKFNFLVEDPTRKVDSKNKKIVVITDNDDSGSKIGKMIQRFTSSFNKSPNVINLNDIDIKGGCLGCMECGYDNQCAYKDDFISFYNSKVIASDIIIFAFELNGRMFSSKWKEYFDRRFFYNHVPEMKGKQLGILISGEVSTYLYDFLQGISEFQQTNLTEIVTDGCSDSEVLNNDIQQLAENSVSFANSGYIKPHTFLGVGSKKIFRDEVFGKLRFVFQADHRFYRKHGFYDFPHTQYKKRLFISFMMLITAIPAIRKLFYGKIKTLLYAPHEKSVDKY
ncbi:MAG: flavodoxin [Desulfobacteraceae bacterium]|nr:flavodoxin [Desulfobacteraceae bacterium]